MQFIFSDFHGSLFPPCTYRAMLKWNENKFWKSEKGVRANTSFALELFPPFQFFFHRHFWRYHYKHYAYRNYTPHPTHMFHDGVWRNFLPWSQLFSSLKKKVLAKRTYKKTIKKQLFCSRGPKFFSKISNIDRHFSRL